MDTHKSKTSSLIEDLVQLLYSQEKDYLDLIDLENQKKTAILEQKSEDLRIAVCAQDEILERLDSHENKRLDLLKALSVAFKKPVPKYFSELLDWNFEGENRERLVHQSFVLKDLMKSLQQFSDLNAAMLLDQRSLFEDLIKSLAKQKSDNYNGNSAKAKPIFVNANC